MYFITTKIKMKCEFHLTILSLVSFSAVTFGRHGHVDCTVCVPLSLRMLVRVREVAREAAVA